VQGGGYLLDERGSLKVQDGLLAELRLDVVRPEPLDHLDVGGEVPEGLEQQSIHTPSSIKDNNLTNTRPGNAARARQEARPAAPRRRRTVSLVSWW